MPDKPASPQPDRLQQDVRRLAAAVAALPEPHCGHVAPLLESLLQASVRRRRILGELREQLAQIRLDTQYLLLDLEATRRERDQLRRSGEG